MYGLGESTVLSNGVSRTNHYPSPYFETLVKALNGLIGVWNNYVKWIMQLVQYSRKNRLKILNGQFIKNGGAEGTRTTYVIR